MYRKVYHMSISSELLSVDRYVYIYIYIMDISKVVPWSIIFYQRSTIKAAPVKWHLFDCLLLGHRVADAHHLRTVYMGLVVTCWQWWCHKYNSACMYVCMYVCMHICMYACMHACTHACMHAFMNVCMCIYRSAQIRIFHSPEEFGRMWWFPLDNSPSSRVRSPHEVVMKFTQITDPWVLLGGVPSGND